MDERVTGHSVVKLEESELRKRRDLVSISASSMSVRRAYNSSLKLRNREGPGGEGQD